MVNVTDFNSTNAPKGSSSEYLSTMAIVNISLQSTIVLFGIIGNILVCIVILRKPKMKSVINYYLLSLAVSDLGILTVSFPIATMRVFANNWLLGRVGCLFVFPTSDLFLGASIWSIKAIAIERYRNIVGSSRFSRNRSTKPAKIVIPLIWAASFLVSSVPMFIVIEYNSENRSCILGWPEGEGWHVAYFVALSVLWYMIPLLVITYTYIHISRTLKQSETFQQASMPFEESVEISQKRLQRSPFTRQSTRARMRRQNNKAKRILTPLVVLFAVTMLPLSTLRIGQFLWGHVISPETDLDLFIVVIYGVIINSSVNPVIYCVVSKDFRQGFKDIFNCISCRKQKASRQFSLSTTRTTRSSKGSLKKNLNTPLRHVVSL